MVMGLALCLCKRAMQLCVRMGSLYRMASVRRIRTDSVQWDAWWIEMLLRWLCLRLRVIARVELLSL